MASNRPTSFFDELKRRSVVRVAAAYLVAAWLLIQIADTVFPYIGIPDYWITRLIGFSAVGFIPALVFAWLF